MKFKIIPYQKKEIDVTLSFSKDYTISVVDKKKSNTKEIVKYSKDTIIGVGKCLVEFVITRGVKDKSKNKVKYFLFFKEFSMNPEINQDYIFYSKSILNDEKIGIDEKRLEELNLSYKLNGKIIDITTKEKDSIEINNDVLNKLTEYFLKKFVTPQEDAIFAGIETKEDTSIELVEEEKNNNSDDVIKKNIDNSKKEKNKKRIQE